MSRMMDGLAALKMPPLMKISRLCTSWLCVIGGETSEAKLVKGGISFGAVQSILTDILGMSKVSGRCVPTLTQKENFTLYFFE